MFTNFGGGGHSGGGSSIPQPTATPIPDSGVESAANNIVEIISRNGEINPNDCDIVANLGSTILSALNSGQNISNADKEAMRRLYQISTLIDMAKLDDNAGKTLSELQSVIPGYL